MATLFGSQPASAPLAVGSRAASHENTRSGTRSEIDITFQVDSSKDRQVPPEGSHRVLRLSVCLTLVATRFQPCLKLQQLLSVFDYMMTD